ncbi:MAG: hypothetical protein ACKV2V_25425 [Blastocatellia bacterium]
MNPQLSKRMGMILLAAGVVIALMRIINTFTGSLEIGITPVIIAVVLILLGRFLMRSARGSSK